LSRILEHGSCRLYAISNDKNEYKRLQRTLSGDNKMSVLDEDLINDTLTDDAIRKLSTEPDIYLIHDPCDIRKPHSRKAENLGKVRDLQNNIINGYSSHNIIAITPNARSVHLISHESYSNKDPKFLKAELVHKIVANKLEEDQVATRELYNSKDWYNKKTLTKDRIQKISDKIKTVNKDQKITHVMDREFDDNDYFAQITEQKDEFVIRSKKSRTVNNINDLKDKKVKLIDSKFSNLHVQKLQKVRFKNTCYQDAYLQVEWGDYEDYTGVKITARNRENQEIFDSPMLLITNKTVVKAEQAILIYQIYLKRSRIESVFKFLKDGLGWEDIQIRDFQAIQRLLSFCFFIAAYLYETGGQEVHDDYVILLARLGGGKGKVSKHYILQGIKALLSKHRVERIFEEYETSQETIENILSISGVSV